MFVLPFTSDFLAHRGARFPGRGCQEEEGEQPPFGFIFPKGLQRTGLRFQQPLPSTGSWTPTSFSHHVLHQDEHLLGNSPPFFQMRISDGQLVAVAFLAHCTGAA